MKTSDFDYFLPQELIAQTPSEKREMSRLLVVDRKTNTFYDKHFYDIIDYMDEGDCLVVNDSKVIPARIYGTKQETGAKIEFLLHKNIEGDIWEVMAKPGKRLKIGTVVDFDGILSAEVLAKKEDGLIDVKFSYEGSFFEILNNIGIMPLPPYIKEKLEDNDRYQTVYAGKYGSSAAPTAGLHMSEELLQKIIDKGIKVVKVTLNVGLGTFLPVSADDISEHTMHSEFYEITEDAAKVINETKASGKKVIALGTTSVRTIESSATFNGKVVPETRNTDIFIYPGYEFKVVDMLITNFHLPKSTLLMLVSAFYDREHTLKAYEYAVEQKYRFFSFGDASVFV
ncbi:MAG: tRNA preQ1(34) S-adenosylmethionine ribosyltransferase-isomerase QueA [Anaerofustis stercorihominis]|nr:tRNA preQ1(34) S-adenosylmethionine ribosyltransferase-isomerase QueA [Anaerofustis stercorihominis]